MNILYICKVSEYQASGNQIDIPKKIGIDFFKIPQANIDNSINTSIIMCHNSDLNKFETFEIQPATNLRFSTKLNSFLAANGDILEKDDLLVFEKIKRCYSVRCIKVNDDQFSPFMKLFDTGEKHMYISASLSNPKITTSGPLQQIFYGAPGTGKSHQIKDNENVKKADERNLVFRTTFHPDSDYSTFVGCYKPTTLKSETKTSQPILDYDSLVDKFKEYLNVPNVNITKACTLFGYDYHDSIVRLQECGLKVMDLVNDAYKSNTSYDSVVRGGMACYEHTAKVGEDSKITYRFTPQAFTKAYTAAWNTTEDVFLIIEEINRGNCAQIFGDLFQLLDRNKDGYSEYPVDPDSDLADYLGEKLKDSTRTDLPQDVKEGKKLVLPNNLYIWATMNTSDQSLFPIDSAFKRRWDWKYVKIKNHPDKNHQIKIGEEQLDWWSFLQQINAIIATMTSSADKQLGYFFCKADNDGVIDEKTFVSKVIFYLWNDVFKDYGFEEASLFLYKVTEGGKEVDKNLTFPDFYDEDGENVNNERLKGFLDSVKNWKQNSEEKQ